MTDPTAAVAATYTYNSFGFLTNSTGNATNWLRYTAREFDSSTGLYYYRARYYDPQVGRFVSEDLARFNGGVNFYSYVANSPVDLSDPLGLCPIDRGQCIQAANQRFINATQGGPSAWQSFKAAQPSIPKTLFAWGAGGLRTWSWSAGGLLWSYTVGVVWNGGAQIADYGKTWAAANAAYEQDIAKCNSL